MADSGEGNDLRRANFRLCRLCIWPNYVGLGFNLENATPPPHVIQTVESNSPAAAGGLKILDLVLAINNQDVSAADYQTVTQAIKNARDSNNRIELLVLEKRFYEPFKRRGISFNPRFARIIETPTAMPRDYMNFPKYTPRTCEMRLNKTDQSFGFEVISGNKNIGAFIQEVVPDTPASRTTLRKSDRILEIDDKFVDDETSRSILNRLAKAKQKRSVKLYVVDTNTYKYFRENRIPLTSKEFRKSKFSKQQQPPTSTYINVEDISTEPKSAAVDIPRPTFPRPTLVDNQRPYTSPSVPTPESHQDDIRLCTINRANATDTYGIELNYHKRDQYHSMKITAGRDNGPSNAELAGVKTNDHLIEINGENIQNIGDEEVKQRIRAIKYPQPLQILVADAETYNYYKQQNKVIHSGLPSVQKLPGNINDRVISTTSSHQEPSVTETLTVVTPVPAEEPSSTITKLVNNNPIQSGTSLENSQPNRRNYKLYRIPGFVGYGFSVNSNQGGNISHKISQIAPNSPAAKQGLRVGDYILTVNDKNVEKMSAHDFNQFLRTSAQNAETHGNPLLLEVINEDSYQPSAIPGDVSTRPSTVDPPSRIPSMNGNFKRQSSYYNPIEPPVFPNRSPKLSETQPTPSRNESQKSSATRPRISRNESRKLSTAAPPITSLSETRKLPTTQPMISPTENHKSTTNQPISSSGNENPKSTVIQPYMNGYHSSLRDQYSRSEIRRSETSSPLLYRSRENLSRGTVDVVSKNRLLRYCRLTIGPGQPFGFHLKADNDKHIIYNIQPDSPAARAGLNENDRLIEVDDQNVEQKSSREVANLIRNATHNRTLRLFIAPSNVKVLSKSSRKSLSITNDDDDYQSKYTDQDKSLSTNSYRSISHLNGEQNYIKNEPTDPLPRKCVLQRDPSFRGCGFQLMEKDNYDTPIIFKISPNSPAQRSGLTEGDHIIYIDSQNVQNFRSFNDITSLIQRTFEENDVITLITLSGPAYQVLKRRGGYLESLAFDYQSPTIDPLKPRLCKLKLHNREQDFGFTVQRNDYLYVKNIEQNSSADINGLKKNDIILELNGKIAQNLTINQIKEIIKISKQEGKLDILVISIDGYQFAIKHAIPLNSLLFFGQTKEERTTISNSRIQQEPVYL